jgi:DNA-binding MarR family transcriptional regulator
MTRTVQIATSSPLTTAQAECLKAIRERVNQPSPTVSDLAEVLKLGRGSVQQILDKLDLKGFIERSRDHKGRVLARTIRLTEKGRKYKFGKAA